MNSSMHCFVGPK